MIHVSLRRQTQTIVYGNLTAWMQRCTKT